MLEFLFDIIFVEFEVSILIGIKDALLGIDDKRLKNPDN